MKLGLGQVAPMIKELRKNETYYKTYNRMLQLESKALQERNGIWSTIPTTSSWWSTYMNLLSRVLDKVRYSVRILNKSATKAVG